MIDSDTEEQYQKDLILLTKEDRLEYAIAAYHKELLSHQQGDQLNPPSMRDYARRYNINRNTMKNRYTGTKTKAEFNIPHQKLSPAEEQSLQDIIQQLESWGFPPYVSRVKEMASNILHSKGRPSSIGINWVQKFLSRHPDLNTRWSRRLERDRFNNCTIENFSRWFNMVKENIEKYDIQTSDIYNMDEKGFQMGHINRERVICSKYNKDVRVKEPTNREWVSILECISADGQLLPPFIIFKGKVQKEAWLQQLLAGGKIALSEKGWTNNTLGLDWLKEVFEPSTKARQKGSHRMLILDGHDSHISNEVINFCIASDIIPACLPSHTTHRLQPLDVSFFDILSSTIAANSQLNSEIQKL